MPGARRMLGVVCAAAVVMAFAAAPVATADEPAAAKPATAPQALALPAFGCQTQGGSTADHLRAAGMYTAAMLRALVGGVAVAACLLSATTAHAQTASVYLSPSGSDSNPCSSARPCASFARGYQVAAPGAAVELAGGTYGGQSIPFVAAKTNPADVVFRPAASASVRVGSIEVYGHHVTLEGLDTHGWHVKPNADDVTFRKVNSDESIFVTSATNVSVYGGTVDGAGRFWNNGSQVKRANTGAKIPENVLFDGVTIRNYRKDPRGSAHVDCLHVLSGRGITVRNSRFSNCEHFDILFTMFLGPTPRDILIENNFFDCCGTGFYSVYLGGGHGESFDNVLIRNNSANKGMTAGTDNSVANVRFVANNVPSIPGCTRPGVTTGYNVFHDSSAERCGPHDKIVPSGFLNPGAFDFHLRANAAARDAGDPTNFPATDIDGQPRPQGAAPDAGADEFDLGSPGSGAPAPQSTPRCCGGGAGACARQRRVCLQVRRAKNAPRWATRRAGVSRSRPRHAKRLRIAYGHVRKPGAKRARILIERRRGGHGGWKRIRVAKVKLGRKGRFAAPLHAKAGVRYRCSVKRRSVRFSG